MSTVSKHNSLDDALGKAKAKFRYWEQKAKEGTDRAMSAKKERDEAKEESRIARLATVVASDARAQAEDDMARVGDALTVVEEAKRKVEVDTVHLEVERMSILLELGRQKMKCPPFSPKPVRQRIQGGGLLEGLRGDLRLWLRMLYVQTQCLWKPTRGSIRHAPLL